MTNKRSRQVVEIQGAAGKRVMRVTLEEPYVRAHEVYLLIQFDDETELQIEIDSRPWFSIEHLGHDADGDLQPLSKAVRGSLRSQPRIRA